VGLFLGLSNYFCAGCVFWVWIGGLTCGFAHVFAGEWGYVFEFAALEERKKQATAIATARQ
jgi:hypothetical protein